MRKNKLNRNLNIGVVGATGMVGKAFMHILEQKQFPLGELRPFASDNSVGKEVSVGSRKFKVQTLAKNCFDKLDLVFFSSGDPISKEWAPVAVQAGAWAVDNSAAFRMDANTHLVVPEVNGDLLNGDKPQIIANPNCSTIQLVVALNPLMKSFGISDVKVSSYQAVSGAGQAAHDELLKQVDDIRNSKSPSASQLPHVIAFNCIPQIGSFDDQGFTSEEKKVMNETKKILRNQQIKVSATTVRVPVLNAHAEAVWVQLQKDISKADFLDCLKSAPGLVIEDDPKNSVYPLQNKISGKDPVYVGRIRKDPNDSKTWLMWIVSDNLLKGAALNGLQIANQIFDIN
jgi:aspartate-semialdehyde dehydrogenase